VALSAHLLQEGEAAVVEARVAALLRGEATDGAAGRGIATAVA
jgi:hypothetical protein